MRHSNICTRERLWLPFLLATGLLVGLLLALAGPAPQASQAAVPAQPLTLVPGAPAGDLEIGQSGPEKTFPGEIISYTLHLVNHGVTAMDNITVTDTWRTDILGYDRGEFDDLWDYGPLMTFEGYSASNPALITAFTHTLNRTLQRGEATWIVNSLPAGGSLDIVFTATTPVVLQPAMANYLYQPLLSKFRVMGPSTLQNTVSALVGTAEYPAEFSTATVMAPLLDVTVSSLGETADKSGGRVGRLITYTVAVENVSMQERIDTWPATHLYVSVTLPYQLNGAIVDVRTSEVGVTSNNSDGFIQWIFPPTFVLTPGMTTYMTFTARIPATLDYNGDEKTLLITKFEDLVAQADLMPLRPASIKASSSVRVWSPFEKVGVTASGKTTTYVNEAVTYTLTFYNPVGVATSLALTDLLHSTFVFSQVVGGSPELLNVTEAVNNIVAWRDVALAPYQVVSVTFVTTPTYATLSNLICNKSLKVSNGVSATSPVFPVVGYVGHNDNKLADITVQPQIKVSKTAVPTQQFPGEAVTYTIALQNQGQSDILEQGTVTDTLPMFFRFITMTAGAPLSYPLVISDTLVRWTEIPTIPAKSTLNISFLAEVDGHAPDSYKNSVEIDIPEVMACSYTGASVKVDSPFRVNKAAALTDPVVQGESFTYTVDIINISPRTGYTITAFMDNLKTTDTGLVTTDTSNIYYYVVTPSVYLPPGGEGTWAHTFPVVLQGHGISAIPANGPWCDNTFSNKIMASLRQAKETFGFRYWGSYWVVNGSADGDFTALPHLSLYQQAYPNLVAISQPVTFVLTLRDNRANPITPAQNVLLRWAVPTGFEFITSSIVPMTQTASELVWNVPSVPFDTDARVIFTLRAPYHRQPGWSKNFNPLAQVIDLDNTSLCIPKTTKLVYATGGATGVPTDGVPLPLPEDITKIAFESSGFQVNQGVEITKKPKPNEIGPYGTVEYEITVRNLTGAPVSSVTITDTLPTYYGSYPWTYLEMVDGPAPDSESPLVWHIPSLEPKSSTSLIFTTRANNWLGVALNEITGTAPINLIQAKTYETDRPVIVSSGIGFFKEASPETIYAGDLVTYTITLFNGEAYKLGNMVITDTLPAGFTFDSMVSPAGLTPQGTTQLVWRILGTLNSGAPYVIRFRARANTEEQGMFTGVYYNEIEASAWNDQNKKPVLIPPSGPTAPVYVQGRPTVAIHKIASVAEIFPDQDFVYTITLYNEADEALTLQVTDTLPVDFTLAEALSPTQATTGYLGDQQWVRWQNLAIAPSSWLTFTFRTHVAIDAEADSYYNQVQVQINEFPTPVVPNLARVRVLIPYEVDAQVSSTNNTQVVPQWPQTITYTIAYTNAATSETAFDSVTLTVTFSPTDYVSIMAGGGWVQSGDQYYKVIAGPLAPGDSGTTDLIVQLDNVPPEIWALHYRVDIAYTTATVAQDINPANNYDEDTDLISAGESVRLLKVASAASVRATEEITYVVTLFNGHPTLSYTVRLSDTLPVSFTWVGPVAPTPAPVWLEEERTAVWEAIVIEPEELIHISYRARADLFAVGASDYCNTAQVQVVNGDVPQPPVSTQSCVAVIPAAHVDVRVTKSNGLDIVEPGETMTYTIIYENSDTSEATLNTVILTETISPYADIQQARWVDTPGVQTDWGNGRYQIAIPVELEPGDVGIAFFAVKLNTSVPTTTPAINNRVDVGYGTEYASIEFGAADNFDLDVDPIRYTDQQIVATKSAIPDELVAGEELEYRIMLHNATGQVQMLHVLDTLPPGIVFVSAVQPTGNVTTTWVGNRQRVIWQSILLQTSEMEIIFRARVERSSAGGSLCNTVQIQQRVGNIYVSQPEVSNLACVAVTPLPVVDIQISKDDGMFWAEAGDTLIYTIHYINAVSSQQSFTALTLTDTFTPTAAIAEVLSADWVSLGGGVYQYTPSEPLAPGTARVANFVVRLSSTLQTVTQLENSVSVTYTTDAPIYEQNQTNNADTDVDVIVPQSLGQIIPWKSVTPGATEAGGIVTYTILLVNTGDADRTVRLTDTLPLSFTLAAGAPDTTFISAGHQQLIWYGVNVPANGQTQLGFTARVAAAAASGSYCNQVHGLPLGGSVVEYEGACVDVSAVVIPQVDVLVTKTDGVTQFRAGDRLTYTLHYASLASSEATLAQVALTETIAPAANVALLSAGWTALGGGRYTRLIGAVAPGVSGDVSFVVQVNGEPTAITNTVEIGYPAQGVQETSLSNNHATDIDTLQSVTPPGFKVYLPCVMRQ